MCHNLWQKHACGHRGSYIRYVLCKYYANTFDILCKVRITNLDLRMKMNECSCKQDHAKEDFEVTNELCRLCRAGLAARIRSPEVKIESP